MFVAMFAVPVDGPAAAAAWVGVSFLLATTAYSAYHVDYVALPAEMTDDRRERTRIMAPRIVLLRTRAGRPALAPDDLSEEPQVQLSLGDVPANLHFSAHAVSRSTVDALLDAVRRSMDAARSAGPAGPVDLSAVNLSTMDEDGFGRLLAEARLSGLRAVNATLDRLPPPAREQALRQFLSVLLTP